MAGQINILSTKENIFYFLKVNKPFHDADDQLEQHYELNLYYPLNQLKT